jgi:hypothetical protein
MSIHDFEIHREAMINWLYFDPNATKVLAKVSTTWLAQQINKQYPGGWAAFVHNQDKRLLEVGNDS